MSSWIGLKSCKVRSNRTNSKAGWVHPTLQLGDKINQGSICNLKYFKNSCHSEQYLGVN